MHRSSVKHFGDVSETAVQTVLQNRCKVVISGFVDDRFCMSLGKVGAEYLLALDRQTCVLEHELPNICLD